MTVSRFPRNEEVKFSELKLYFAFVEYLAWLKDKKIVSCLKATFLL